MVTAAFRQLSETDGCSNWWLWQSAWLSKCGNGSKSNDDCWWQWYEVQLWTTLFYSNDEYGCNWLGWEQLLPKSILFNPLVTVLYMVWDHKFEIEIFGIKPHNDDANSLAGVGLHL